MQDDNDPFANEYMDCVSCPLDDATRRRWCCAWIPDDEHTGAAPVPPEYSGERPEVCPGYLISLPQVIEAARASSWRKEGALREFYDGRPLTEIAKYSIDVMAGAQREVENYNVRAARPKE